MSAIHAERRARFIERMGEGVAIFASAPVAIRNNDVEHDYRQDSDFYYLTGFDEPESVLVLANVPSVPQCTLFVRPRDPAREVWDGPREGVEGAVDHLGADAAYSILEFRERLPEYLSRTPRLHYRLAVTTAMDDIVLNAITRLRGESRRGLSAPIEIVDSLSLLHEMRMRKDEHELACMRRAAEITKEAHVLAMQKACDGAFEYEIEAWLHYTFRSRGSERPAYGSIVGSGPNATVLHHRKNDRRMQAGELLLIDAGAEFQYYACDVTRTFPVQRRFSAEQRALYEIVLRAQKAAIAKAVSGVTLDDIHAAAVEIVTEGLVDLGFVEGPVGDAVREHRYRPFFMHRTSHWLGMDVHDVGAYSTDGKPRPLEPGFVLTVEPGIYVAKDAPVPEAFRGLGIRIEDDVVVRQGAPEVLTYGIPKEIDDIEALVATA